MSESYSSYDKRARQVLSGSGDANAFEHVTAEKPTRRRRSMTPERLSVLLAENRQYEASDRSPLKELARDYGVSVSTVSRWR